MIVTVLPYQIFVKTQIYSNFWDFSSIGRKIRHKTLYFSSKMCGRESAQRHQAIRMSTSLAADRSYTGAGLVDRTGRLLIAERRRNPRAPLQWTVYLAFKGSAHPFRSITRDINKDGFYCSLDQPVRPGERIECDIAVPTHGSRDLDDVAYLRCLAQAVRVEKIGDSPKFGVACRIEDYRLIHIASPRLGLRKDGIFQGGSTDPR